MSNNHARHSLAAIVSCGDELVTGQTVDTNSAWLSQQLANMGVVVVRHVTVGDDAAATANAIRESARLAGWVVVTGGLGPTPDDLTRDTASMLLGEPLEIRPDALAQVESWFKRAGRAMAATNIVQAKFPASAEVIRNDRGTAPGLKFNLSVEAKPETRACGPAAKQCDGQAVVFCLPGVPGEMRAMFDASVAPAIREKTGDGRVLLVRTVHTFGIGESDLAGRLGDLLVRDRNPQIGTTAGGGSVSVRIYARADSAEQARAMLDDAERRVVEVLGPRLCFGRDGDTLESIVGQMLRERGQTLATAESCTGGMLSQLITAVPGSSDYFIESIVTYADEAKLRRLDVQPTTLARFGAVSEATAGEMAAGLRRSSNADWAISITGIAGPGGGSADKPVGLVFIGLCGPGSAGGPAIEQVHRFIFPGDRDAVRLRAARMAMNCLRLAILA